jgi:cytochrome c-type biogenesis protein CcmE
MMTRKKRRLWVVLACGLGLSTATALMLVAFRSSLTFFMSPQQVLAANPAPGSTFRLGGIVQVGTVVESQRDGRPYTRFSITDGRASIPVVYTGVLPGLFREGQGVVTVGSMAPGDKRFRAANVLAKHGSTYMPLAVEQALRKSGKWNPKFGPPPAAGTWDSKSPRAIVAENGKA